jgi:AbrB family looped-hinge helix DNA binding protein
MNGQLESGWGWSWRAKPFQKQTLKYKKVRISYLVINVDVEIAKMSSKGQIVVPRKLRKRLNAHEGTLFAVVGTSDSLVLKKVSTPSKDELLSSIRGMAREATSMLRGRGLKEKDIIRIAVGARGAK